MTMSDLPDDDLMRELKAAWSERDLVTDSARRSAEGAYAWRTIDAELLVLSYDSLLADELSVRRAGGVEVRTASFHGNGIILEIEIDNGDLLGQLVPGQACRVTLESTDQAARSTDADEAGFFSFPNLAGGSVRFRFEINGSMSKTDWWTL